MLGQCKIGRTADGEEYLEFNERPKEPKEEPVQTAARSGECRLKQMLATVGSEKDRLPFIKQCQQQLKGRVASNERVVQGWSCWHKQT